MTTGSPEFNFRVKKARYVNGLDSIRILLALIVLLSHMPVPLFSTLKASDIGVISAFGRFVPTLFCGTAAVIAFFIVSGFIIHYTNQENTFDTKKFLIKRVLRIACPPLAIFLLGSIFMKQNLLLQMPLWSLYCEIIYYFLYPILRKSKISWTIQFIVSFIASYGLIIFLDGHDINSLIHQSNLGYIVGGYGYMQFGDLLTWIVGLPCWILGVVLAEKFEKSTRTSSVFRILLVRLLLILCTSIIAVLNFKFFVSYMLSMNAFAIILCLWIYEELIYYKSHKSVFVIEELGKSSYSLYLLHYICLVNIEKWMEIGNATYFPIILAVVCIAYVFYIVVENPTHKFAQRIVRSL